MQSNNSHWAEREPAVNELFVHSTGASDEKQTDTEPPIAKIAKLIGVQM